MRGRFALTTSVLLAAVLLACGCDVIDVEPEPAAELALEQTVQDVLWLSLSEHELEESARVLALARRPVSLRTNADIVAIDDWYKSVRDRVGRDLRGEAEEWCLRHMLVIPERERVGRYLLQQSSWVRLQEQLRQALDVARTPRASQPLLWFAGYYLIVRFRIWFYSAVLGRQFRGEDPGINQVSNPFAIAVERLARQFTAVTYHTLGVEAPWFPEMMPSLLIPGSGATPSPG